MHVSSFGGQEEYEDPTFGLGDHGKGTHTVTCSSIYVLVEEVVLAEYILSLKRRMGLKTKVIEILVYKPSILSYCLPHMPLYKINYIRTQSALRKTT